MNGCDENTIDGWEPSSFPDGARLVNIQRGDKGFGVFLMEQKVYDTVHVLVKVYAVYIWIIYSRDINNPGPSHWDVFNLCPANPFWKHS